MKDHLLDEQYYQDVAKAAERLASKNITEVAEVRFQGQQLLESDAALNSVAVRAVAVQVDGATRVLRSNFALSGIDVRAGLLAATPVVRSFDFDQQKEGVK